MLGLQEKHTRAAMGLSRYWAALQSENAYWAERCRCRSIGPREKRTRAREQMGCGSKQLSWAFGPK